MTTTDPTHTEEHVQGRQQPSGEAHVRAAYERLRTAREMDDALAPLHRLMQGAAEEKRAAAIAAVNAGLAERAIAAELDVSPATVHSWLDGRTSAPRPAPTLAEQVWALHHVTRALGSLAHWLRGRGLEGRGDPVLHVNTARSKLDEAAFQLGNAGNSLDAAARLR